MITAKELRESLRKHTEELLIDYGNEMQKLARGGYCAYADNRFFRKLDDTEKEYVISTLNASGFEVTWNCNAVIARW